MNAGDFVKGFALGAVLNVAVGFVLLGVVKNLLAGPQAKVAAIDDPAWRQQLSSVSNVI